MCLVEVLLMFLILAWFSLGVKGLYDRQDRNVKPSWVHKRGL